MAEPLTKIEKRILDYIVDYLRENTYQPSIREIGKRFGIKSTKTVSEYLQVLADKGHIEREASRSRGVKILGIDLGGGTQADVAELPYYGKIAAGQPALIDDHVETRYTLDRRWAVNDHTFLLEVDGESMTEMGIFDKDKVIVDPVEEHELEDGEIVAARIDGGATVKRYFEREGQVVLEPANTDFAPILVSAYEDFTILGRVVGLVRLFRPQQTRPS